MKTSVLAFSFICFAFNMELFITAAAAPEPVLDTSGQKLVTGVKYYILPASKGNGGGLALGSIGGKFKSNNTCTLHVLQVKRENTNDDRAIFTPYNAKDGVILTSTDLNIKLFSLNMLSCVGSPVARLLKETTSGLWFLATASVEGNPGVETIDNWFKIEKSDNHIVLSFCPKVCSKFETLCKALAMFVEGRGNKHLAIKDKVDPFRVVFERAYVNHLISHQYPDILIMLEMK